MPNTLSPNRSAWNFMFPTKEVADEFFAYANTVEGVDFCLRSVRDGKADDKHITVSYRGPMLLKSFQQLKEKATSLGGQLMTGQAE